MALWSRIDDFQPRRLHDAARRKDIVRGSCLRCTLHTTSADDFVAFRMLLQSVIDREVANRRRLMGGFDARELESAARALMVETPLTAQQLGERLLPRFPKARKAGIAHWVRTRIALAIVPGDARWGYARPPHFVPAEQWLGRSLARDTPLPGAAAARAVRDRSGGRGRPAHLVWPGRHRSGTGSPAAAVALFPRRERARAVRPARCGAAAIEVQLFGKTSTAARHEVATEAEALLRMLEPQAATYAVRVVPKR